VAPLPLLRDDEFPFPNKTPANAFLTLPIVIPESLKLDEEDEAIDRPLGVENEGLSAPPRMDLLENTAWVFVGEPNDRRPVVKGSSCLYPSPRSDEEEPRKNIESFPGSEGEAGVNAQADSEGVEGGVVAEEVKIAAVVVVLQGNSDLDGRKTGRERASGG